MHLSSNAVALAAYKVAITHLNQQICTFASHEKLRQKLTMTRVWMFQESKAMFYLSIMLFLIPYICSHV